MHEIHTKKRPHSDDLESGKESEGQKSICSSKALQFRVIALVEHETRVLW